MNTAEVTVEQILAGIVGLVLCGLPFIQPHAIAELKETAAAIGFLGTAYMVGAVFDKLFDTILGGAEQWTRLAVASDCLKRGTRSGQDDPFNQARLEVALREGSGAAAWMSFLRTRVRLARTLGVGAPLVAYAASTAMLFASSDRAQREGAFVQVPGQWDWVLALLPSGLLVLGAFAGLALRLPKTYKWDYEKCRALAPDPAEHMQKTDERCHEKRRARRRAARAKWPTWIWWLAAWGPPIVVYVGALAASIVVGCIDHGWSTTALVLAGVIVGALSLWAWKSILLTYMSYLVNTGRYGRDRAAVET